MGGQSTCASTACHGSLRASPLLGGALKSEFDGPLRPCPRPYSSRGWYRACPVALFALTTLRRSCRGRGSVRVARVPTQVLHAVSRKLSIPAFVPGRRAPCCTERHPLGQRP